jgi:hypothetical protein
MATTLTTTPPIDPKNPFKDPEAPSKATALSEEQFFNQIFKPSIGGDNGIISKFYGSSGPRQGGRNPSIDGYARAPSFGEFISNTGTYSHRHDGKIYAMPSIIDNKKEFDAAYQDYVSGLNASNDEARKTYENELSYNSDARKILSFTESKRMDANATQAALANLSAARNYGASNLGTKLNFQVSDDQIINDYNEAKLNSLKSVLDRGNTQIVGINDKIVSTNELLSKLKADDPRRAPLEASLKTLNEDIKSVNEAITSAQAQVAGFKPITALDTDGQKEITSFREFLKLPEERASDQLKQIDPKAYETAVALGDKYRKLATEELPATTSQQTEDLRGQIEQEALNQLRLGSTLGADERRQYEQAARAAQTVRGNIFGVAPAVQEAVESGAAGEARKLARFGAASQFLSSGQTTGDALQRDIALRDALLQTRLGSASGFLASGPSLYNLGNARTAQQNAAFQNYIQANQALPGNFGQGASTAANFYQTTDPNAPLALQQAAVSLYNGLLGYQASTYGNMLQAQSQQPSGAAQFAQIAGGIGNIASPIAGGFKSYTLGGVK